MSNYSASTQSALEATCALGPDKCGHYEGDGICAAAIGQQCGYICYPLEQIPTMPALAPTELRAAAARCKTEAERLLAQRDDPLIRDCPAALDLADKLAAFWERQQEWYEAMAAGAESS